MFEDKYMFKVICGILCFASIIIPGPIVPIISLVIAIALLVHKIKLAKESPEGFLDLMIDIALIVILVVVDIGCFALRVSIENEFDKYNYSQSSQKEMTASEFADSAIAVYKLGHLAQFTDDGKDHTNAIKKGFTSYLKEELELTDVKVNGNKITCNIKEKKITFTITKNDIKYSSI